MGCRVTDNEIRQILVSLARIEEQLKAVVRSVDDLNSFRDWAIKLVIGAVILGLMGLLYAQSR